MRKSFWIAGVLMALAACTPPESKFLNESQFITGTGTVVFVDMEGGFYGIKADEGDRYDVYNMPKEFQEDGLRVRFRGRVTTNAMTTRMWGIALEVSRMESLKE